MGHRVWVTVAVAAVVTGCARVWWRRWWPRSCSYGRGRRVGGEWEDVDGGGTVRRCQGATASLTSTRLERLPATGPGWRSSLRVRPSQHASPFNICVSFTSHLACPPPQFSRLIETSGGSNEERCHWWPQRVPHSPQQALRSMVFGPGCVAAVAAVNVT